MQDLSCGIRDFLTAECDTWYIGKESACQCRRHRRCGFHPWSEKICWRRKWQPTPVFFPGKSYGQRRLEDYSPESQRVGHDWANKHMRPLSWGMWDLVPWPGIEPGPLALEAWSLSHWTIREVQLPGPQGPPARFLYISIGSSLVTQTVKASAYNAGYPGSIIGSGKSPGEGNGNSLQYSCLENPMDWGAW